MDVVDVVAGEDIHPIRNDVFVLGLAFFGPQGVDLQAIARPHRVQGRFQLDDMVPVAIDQQMGAELSAQFGHAAFQNIALAFLDSSGEFFDQFQSILSRDGDDELHDFLWSRIENKAKFNIFRHQFRHHGFAKKIVITLSGRFCSPNVQEEVNGR